MIPYREARAVNQQVNENNAYLADQSQYRQSEFWEPIRGAGDCEDFALGKREALLLAGHSADDISLATCWTETKEYHAVLIVNTSDGQYVLDNRYQEPMTKQLLGYRWDKIQKGSLWYALS